MLPTLAEVAGNGNPVRAEFPTTSVGSSQAAAAVKNSAPLKSCPEFTYKSGKVVQTSGATSWAEPFLAGMSRIAAQNSPPRIVNS